MNILVDRLPTSVEIDGVEYAIRTDYRNALRVILAFEDNELANREKAIIMIRALYDEIPPDTDKAVEKAIWFLNAGLESDDTAPRVYSFTKDGSYIYSAYRQSHGVDLQTSQMHWWQFVALFMDLGDTVFTNLVSLRKRVKTGKATKEEKKTARELGDMFDVPDIDDRSLGEMEADREFMRRYEKGRRLRDAQT